MTRTRRQTHTSHETDTDLKQDSEITHGFSTEAWLIDICDSSIRVTHWHMCLIDMCDSLIYVTHWYTQTSSRTARLQMASDSFHMCDMITDGFTLVHTCDMITYGFTLVHTCDMRHLPEVAQRDYTWLEHRGGWRWGLARTCRARRWSCGMFRPCSTAPLGCCTPICVTWLIDVCETLCVTYCSVWRIVTYCSQR